MSSPMRAENKIVIQSAYEAGGVKEPSYCAEQGAAHHYDPELPGHLAVTLFKHARRLWVRS